jgi:uncharacterized membrane protein YfcA
MDPSLALLAFTALTFLLAGAVKGAIGFGLPTIAMGMLAMAMPPAQAAALLVVPSFVTNIWQLAAGPHLAAPLRRLWPLLLGIGVGTGAGAGLLTADGGGLASPALGAALMLYAILGFGAVQFSVPARAEVWLSPLIGAATGVVTAATGVFVIPAVPYLQALGLDKDDLVQALGLSFTASTFALAVILAADGTLKFSLAGVSLLALAPALVGMIAGQRLRALTRPDVFRYCFFAALLVLGGHLVLRAFF